MNEIAELLNEFSKPNIKEIKKLIFLVLMIKTFII